MERRNCEVVFADRNSLVLITSCGSQGSSVTILEEGSVLGPGAPSAGVSSSGVVERLVWLSMSGVNPLEIDCKSEGRI